MDYPSDPNVGLANGKFTDGDPVGGVEPSLDRASEMNAIYDELINVILGSGQVPDEAVFTQLFTAIKRLVGRQVTIINASRALTVEDAGVVLVNATAGNITLTLPASNVLAALEYTLVRIDTTANTSALQRSGADTIDGAVTHPFDYFAALNVLANGASEWLRIGGVPAGKMGYWGRTTPPAGYLERNGAAVSRTTYKRLFAAIGTTYGVGDGATTFNLPDGRGDFDRGYDNGRGIDTGRVFGSAQADDIKSHRHNIQWANPGGANAMNGGGTAANGQGNDATAVGLTGGTETRPRNTAHLAIIKY